ncbi:Nucleoporin 160kD, partial [Carabus blaptoides fortunei]
MPDTVVFMQAYYVVMWLCEQQAVPVSLSEDSAQRLAPLKLSPVFNLKTKHKHLMTLVQLFSSSTGGTQAHSAFAKSCPDEEMLAHWHHALLDYVNQLGQLVWAVSGHFVLGEWLLASGQHVLLQQYVRLLNPWCEWNNCSRNFVLAAALLNNSEKYKAKDLFLKSSKGIFLERFLADRVLTSDDDNDAKALVNYHLKVIQLFELHGARDCAIDVARTALSAADSDDPHI